MNDKIILTDIDGVCLDWEGGFSTWFESKGHTVQITDHKLTYNLAERYGITFPELMVHVNEFNESDGIGKLSPHRDAVEYIAKISDEGYRFIAITSMSKVASACKLRTQHLKDVFGDVFDKYIFLDTGAGKTEVLAQYKDSGYFWIEDKIENAKAGLEVGLTSIIMEHGFNMHSTIAPRIKNWQHFYEKYIINS